VFQSVILVLYVTLEKSDSSLILHCCEVS